MKAEGVSRPLITGGEGPPPPPYTAAFTLRSETFRVPLPALPSSPKPPLDTPRGGPAARISTGHLTHPTRGAKAPEGFAPGGGEERGKMSARPGQRTGFGGVPDAFRGPPGGGPKRNPPRGHPVPPKRAPEEVGPHAACREAFEVTMPQEKPRALPERFFEPGRSETVFPQNPGVSGFFILRRPPLARFPARRIFAFTPGFGWGNHDITSEGKTEDKKKMGKKNLLWG